MKWPRKDSSGFWILINARYIWLFLYRNTSWGWRPHLSPKMKSFGMRNLVIDAWKLRITINRDPRLYPEQEED